MTPRMTLAERLASSYNPRIAEALAAATRVAPFPSLLGFEVADQRPGHVACTLRIADRHKNGIGLLHGGVLTALIDHALSVVVYPHVEPGKWVATLEMKVSYLAPVRDGEVVAEADIVSLRRATGVVRIDVKNRREDAEEELVAAALGTVYVKDRPEAGRASA